MKKILPIVLFVLCSCGVDRYELTEDKNGRIIRLDKLTGRMTILDGDKLVEVKTSEDIEAARVGTQELAKAKEWPELHLKQYGIEQIRFITSWREGVLHYRVRLQPYIEELRQGEQNRIIFHLRDEGAFLLLEISPILRSYTRVVDDEGKFRRLEFEGTVLCSESTYRNIGNIDLQFVLPESLLNQYKAKE